MLRWLREKIKPKNPIGTDETEEDMVQVNLDIGERKIISRNVWLGRGQKCPACGSLLFFEGPHGGYAVNIKCANVLCGKCWYYGPPFTEIGDCGLYGKQPKPLDDIL